MVLHFRSALRAGVNGGDDVTALSCTKIEHLRTSHPSLKARVQLRNAASKFLGELVCHPCLKIAHGANNGRHSAKPVKTVKRRTKSD
ncbi:MAG: hypothetical protein EOM51_10580 [Clostridia bacterium]|nr:hypothetical protein [Clostridia bacterium]